MKIYTVAVFWTDIDCLSDAFISVFSTREAAESFAAKARKRLLANYTELDFRIYFDSVRLDSEEYLDYIDSEE